MVAVSSAPLEAECDRTRLCLLLAAWRTLSVPDFSVLVRTMVMMFANQVVGRYGEVHGRDGKQQAWPTDRQAEVLYPKQLSCEHLLCIYVQCEDSADRIHGIQGGLQMSVDVRHSPEVFE